MATVARLLNIDEIAHTDLNAGCSQRELVEMTSITTLHAKALAELLNAERVSAVEIVAELRAVGVPVSATQLSTSLSEGQRWALAFQTTTCLTRILPEN